MLFSRACAFTTMVLFVSTFTEVSAVPLINLFSKSKGTKSLTTKVTLPLPGTSGSYQPVPGETLFATKLSQEGTTTTIKIVDSFAQPTPHATTFTLIVGPTQVVFDITDEAAGLKTVTESCSLPGDNGQTHCVADTVDDNGNTGTQSFDLPLGTMELIGTGF